MRERDEGKEQHRRQQQEADPDASDHPENR